MNDYQDNTRLMALADKGGVLRFVIERDNFLYQGMIILSKVEDSQRTRIVCIKKYTRRSRMKQLKRRNHKKTKHHHRKPLSFLEAVRLYAGMPVEV